MHTVRGRVYFTRKFTPRNIFNAKISRFTVQPSQNLEIQVHREEIHVQLLLIRGQLRLTSISLIILVTQTTAQTIVNARRTCAREIITVPCLSVCYQSTRFFSSLYQGNTVMNFVCIAITTHDCIPHYPEYDVNRDHTSTCHIQSACMVPH